MCRLGLLAGCEAGEISVRESALHETLLAHQDQVLAFNLDVPEVERGEAEVEVLKSGLALTVKALRDEVVKGCAVTPGQCLLALVGKGAGRRIIHLFENLGQVVLEAHVKLLALSNDRNVLCQDPRVTVNIVSDRGVS